MIYLVIAYAIHAAYTQADINRNKFALQMKSLNW